MNANRPEMMMKYNRITSRSWKIFHNCIEATKLLGLVGIFPGLAGAIDDKINRDRSSQIILYRQGDLLT